MKTILKFTLLLVLVVSIQACSDDFLNLEFKNYQSDSNYFTTEASALAATNACYDAIKGRGLFGETYQYVFNGLDDRLIHETPTFENFSYNPTDGNIGGNNLDFSIWDAAYRGVVRTNMAITKIPEIKFKAVNEPLKARYLAEAHFLRALYYFHLQICFYNPPLITRVMTDPQETVGNNTPEEIWAQIESDLKYANAILPESYDNANVGRATKGAANALLGKSYLYQQKWDSAKVYLKKVMDSNKYALVEAKAPKTMEDYIAAYQCNFTTNEITVGANKYAAENNVESVFEIQNSNNSEMGYPNGEWSPGNGSDGSLYSAYFSCVIGYNNVTPDTAAVSVSKMIFKSPAATAPAGLTKDARFYASVFTSTDTLSRNAASKYFNKKPPVTNGFSLKKYLWPVHEGFGAPYYDPNNWRLIRYSDVLLMYAEACYQANADADGSGLTAFNKVRERAGMDPLAALTPQAIIDERDVEFYGESMRFHDLVRWSLLPSPWVAIETLDHMKPSGSNVNFVKGKHEYLPIPQSEIDAMQGKLKQNPYWD